MRTIRLENITKYNSEDEKVLDSVSLEIPGGEFFALLGPSGCGKTTLLRLIAGFTQPEQGHIFLGQDEITRLPPHKRRVSIVVQNYALFPHLDVFHNVAYSLTIQKQPKEEIEHRVLRILKAFHLENHIFKYPAQLSGGQQQRVAIARAIINDPEVLLLDEPLAALDFKLREKMLIELIELQDRLKTTFIYVTHDQFEALTVADHLSIMNHEGNIEQIGTPKEIYEFPNSSFVAKFVGTTNTFAGTLCSDDEIEIPELGRLKIFLPQKKEWMKEGADVVMSLRPEKVFISKQPVENFTNTLTGVVNQIVYYGRSTQYNVLVNGQVLIQVFEQNEEHFAQENIDYDDEVYLYWQKENVVILKE